MVFLDGHSSHFSLELLRKAQELDIKLIAYPAHCTHILQGLDVVCFAKLKKELADEIRNWNDSHQQGIQKRDFAGVFGRAYLRAFTPELVKSAWKAVGIHPYNPDIIPLDKLAPSETSTILRTVASAVHSTPVRKIMSVFSYFDASLGQQNDHNGDQKNDCGGDNNTNGGNGGNGGGGDGGDGGGNGGGGDRGGVNSATSYNDGRNGSGAGDNDGGDDGGDDNTDDPFLLPFTPRSRMHILHKSFASNSTTSYLVSREPINSSLDLIKPVHEKPYFTEEPDWSLIQRPMMGDLNQLPREKLLERCLALEVSLDRTKRQIRARDAVVEASRATAAILELHAQKLRTALHMKEEDRKRRQKTKISLNVGDGVVINEEEFIKKVEAKRRAQEKKQKEKEGRKRERQRKHLLRNAQREAWEIACNEYDIAKATHDRVCQELRDNGTKVRDLPPRPKQQRQKEVFDKVREQWEGNDGELMNVDEDVSEFDETCEIEVSSLHEDDGGSLDWYGSGREEEEEEEDQDADVMDVDEP